MVSFAIRVWRRAHAHQHRPFPVEGAGHFIRAHHVLVRFAIDPVDQGRHILLSVRYDDPLDGEARVLVNDTVRFDSGWVATSRNHSCRSEAPRLRSESGGLLSLQEVDERPASRVKTARCLIPRMGEIRSFRVGSRTGKIAVRGPGRLGRGGPGNRLVGSDPATALVEDRRYRADRLSARSSFAGSGAPPPPSARGSLTPETAKVDHVDDYFGTRVSGSVPLAGRRYRFRGQGLGAGGKRGDLRISRQDPVPHGSFGPGWSGSTTTLAWARRSGPARTTPSRGTTDSRTSRFSISRRG